MSDKIVVLVSDRGDSRHGEISVVDDPRKAEKLVETLLEAGFEQERIHVFAGRESDFQVSQRPVVALVGEGEEGEPQVGVAVEEAAAPEAGPAAPPEAGPDVEVTEGGGRQREESKTEEIRETEETEKAEEEVPATAETGAPVRFSSLFRSA